MNASSSAPGDRRPSAGILAGGAGSRFGGMDKGWIELRGRPLIEWTIEAVRPQATEVLVSANRNLERYRALGVTVLGDAGRAEGDGGSYDGPLAGLVRLLGAAGHEWLLCLPCDAVRIPADLGRQFALAIEASAADIAVLADADGLHPTFCLVRTSLAADARRCFEEGERGLKRWFSRHRLERVEGATPVNINTPEALRALELRL